VTNPRRAAAEAARCEGTTTAGDETAAVAAAAAAMRDRRGLEAEERREARGGSVAWRGVRGEGAGICRRGGGRGFGSSSNSSSGDHGDASRSRAERTRRVDGTRAISS
jgi:hypothetical protein